MLSDAKKQLCKDGYESTEMVLVKIPDRNRKAHFVVVSNMEEAKKVFPSDYDKRIVQVWKSKEEGFYGSIWGSGVEEPEITWNDDFHDLELVYFKGHKIAGFGLPSCYSCEGYHSIWYIDDYGKDWWLKEASTNNELESEKLR